MTAVPLGACTVQPVHALDDAALLGAQAQCGFGWTAEARGRLGVMLLSMACDEAAAWQDLTNTARLSMSVRMPAGIACGPALIDEVVRALARVRLSDVVLELGLCRTLSQTVGPAELLAWSALRDMGLALGLEVAGPAEGLCSTAFDEMGGLPFSSLRLPGSAAALVESDRAHRQLIRFVVQAAHRQDAIVIATGVRTAMQCDILADLGCHAAQGPLFGLPMHPAVFQAALLDCAAA